MTVEWGTNQLTNCVSLLTWKDQIVLSVVDSPLQVDLNVPDNLKAAESVDAKSNLHIEKNVAQSNNAAQVIASADAVSILFNGVAILMAQRIAPERVLLHVDLRSVGMNIYDDSAGLHIGASILAKNQFCGCSTAIALG